MCWHISLSCKFFPENLLQWALCSSHESYHDYCEGMTFMSDVSAGQPPRGQSSTAKQLTSCFSESTVSEIGTWLNIWTLHSLAVWPCFWHWVYGHRIQILSWLSGDTGICKGIKIQVKLCMILSSGDFQRQKGGNPNFEMFYPQKLDKSSQIRGSKTVKGGPMRNERKIIYATFRVRKQITT